MADCPTLKELEQLASSTDDPHPSTAGTHLRHCDTCRQTVENIRANLALFDECQNLNTVLTRRAPRQNRNRKADDDLWVDQDAPEPPPDIPGYDILEEIHRGAQGVVYKAIHRNAKRTVALKVTLHGLYASRKQKHRFEREIEFVAGLEHPNIVRLYDSGRADGRHYFVMQYVDGLPLDQYVEQHLSDRPTLPFRQFAVPLLRLFTKIVRAVAYAHQRGIIHRDLKPRNILIDEKGEPHVLDFGLAKPANAISRFDTLATQTGEFLGTLAYASPEQVSGDPDSIDTRTDVYALGIILYELLTDHRPYDIQGSITETLANITKINPSKPSHHDRRLGNELDTIILKTLAKHPGRRYQSADALADDIDRYLTGRPVHAKADTPLYVLRKYLARHKFAAAMMFALSSTITIGLIVSIAFWRQAAHQRDRAATAEIAATGQRDRAVTAERHALQMRDAAEKSRIAAERSLYFNNITLAAIALEKNDIAQLKHLLEECPPKFRAWEWRRLHWLSDRSVLTFTGHADEIYPVVISADGKRVASGGRDRLIKIWNPATGQEIHTLRGHTGTVGNLAFSRDGSRLVSAAHDMTMRLWDTTSGIPLLIIPYGHQEPPSIAISPDNRLIATAAWNQRLQDPSIIKLWDAQSGQLRLTIPTPTSSWITVTFTPDGQRIISKHADGTTRKWNADTGALVSGPTPFDKDDPANPLNPLGSHRLYHTAGDEIFFLMDATTHRKLRTFRGHLSPLHSMVISPDGKFIVSGSVDATCKVWNPDAPTEALVGKAPSTIASAVFSPDGKHIATGCTDGTVHIWNADCTGPLKTFHGTDHHINSIAYSPDGRRLVAGSTNPDPHANLFLWDLNTGKQTLALEGHPDGVPVVAFSPDGRRIITGGWDGTVRIHDAHTGELLHTFKQAGEVWDLAVSPNGKYIASGGQDPNVYLWNLESGKEIWQQKAHTLEVDALAFSPDSKTVVSGANDGRLILRNISDAQPIWEKDTKLSRFYAALFTHDSRRIITSHDEGRINIWDAATGRLVYAWNAHEGDMDTIYTLALSPDGRSLLSGGDHGTFKIWPTSPSQ